MANYPGSIPNLTNPTPGDKLNDPDHADQHADANDEIEAIATELGTDVAGTATDLKTRLAVEHNTDGTHADITADSVTSTVLTVTSATITACTITSATVTSLTATACVVTSATITTLLVSSTASGGATVGSLIVSGTAGVTIAGAFTATAGLTGTTLTVSSTAATAVSATGGGVTADRLVLATVATTATAVSLDFDTITTGRGIDITADGLTTGSALYIDSDSADGSARNLVEIIQNHADANGVAVMKLQQDSDGHCLYLDINGGGSAIIIEHNADTEANVPAISMNVVQGTGGTAAAFGFNGEEFNASTHAATAAGNIVVLAGATVKYIRMYT